MLAVDLIQVLSQAVFVVVFALTVARAIRHPRRATILIALLFGSAAVNVAAAWVFGALGMSQPDGLSQVSSALALSIPYLLLLLVHEFAGVPWPMRRAAELALAVGIIGRFVTGTPPPVQLTLFLLAYFFVVTLYVAIAFAREARASVGSTTRQMGAVAIGCGCLTIAIVIAGLRAAFPALVPALTVFGGPFGLAFALAFWMGFATPGWLLRAWREPEFRHFVEQADALTAESDLPTLIRGIQAAAAQALGMPGVFVGVWNEREHVLEYATTRLAASDIAALGPGLSFTGQMLRTPPGVLVGGRCFVAQRPLYIENVEAFDPDHAGLYRTMGVEVAIAAPMTVEDERFGVLGVHTARRRLFAEDSLARLEILARHAAVMLRSRRLVEQAVTVRAEAVVVRQKEEFLASTTHDLKTPLTVIKVLAGNLRRMAAKEKPIVKEALVGQVQEVEAAADRMAALINEMLDMWRLEMTSSLELSPTSADLAQLVRTVAQHHDGTTSIHRIKVEAPQSVVGEWDAPRITRVVDNLVSNAVKFSPDGGEILIAVRLESTTDGERAMLSVEDPGLGIPAADLDRIFIRFARGSNAAQRGIAGTGIGLAYVRAIVNAHGGQVSVSSTENQGAIFTVSLPTRVHSTESNETSPTREALGDTAS
ncbi:MAG TPA: ATP-binding protein [Chloroflexota bacterium]